MNTDEVQTNLDEMDRRYKSLMRKRLLSILICFAGLAVIIIGFGRILWYIWGLG